MTGATLLVAAPPARRARDRPLDGALHRRRELRRLRDVVRTVGSGGGDFSTWFCATLPMGFNCPF